MTLRDLIGNGCSIGGYQKIQSWEGERYPTIYYEGHEPGDLSEILDREVVYIFPYNRAINSAGICIELRPEKEIE